MCGVSGIITNSSDRDWVLNRLYTMGDLQKHRGPDDRREMVFSARRRLVGFGFTRLSILDLETGMQPITCDYDGTAIVCNGQVYNYLELKQDVGCKKFVTRGDIEVALHAYRKNGADFLGQLNGMYAGAIFDPAKGQVLLFRDRFGIKPLYYTEHEGNFVFASEVRALLAGSMRPSSLNRSVLAKFFTYRYIPGQNTMFEGVKLVPPGSFLVYDLGDGSYTIRRYWEYLPGDIATMSADEATEAFYELFSDAVRIRLRSDVEMGCLVSGGIDSSAVASRTVEQNGPSKLFTVSFDEQPYNELPDVLRFMDENRERFHGCEHFTSRCGKDALDRLPEIVDALEEPLSLGAVLPTDQVCELAGNKLKVVITGEGADEIFAGYRKFLLEAAADEFGSAPVERRKQLGILYPELADYLSVRHADPAKRYIQSEILFNEHELEQLIGADTGDTSFPADALPGIGDGVHPVNTAIAFECRARLPDYVLLRLDKLSMRHSLETRTPFLDYRLAEFAAALPVCLKVDAGLDMEKVICRSVFARYGLLDRQTAFRKKQPFTIPLADWLSRPEQLPEWMQDIMLGDVVRDQGIVNPEFFKDRAGRVSSGGVGPNTLVSEADRVFSVIMFTVWYDRFISRKGVCGG